MSVLLEKITKIDEPAAKKIEEAGFRSDSEIRDLTREDLRELLPGPKNMKIRINIFKTISKTDSLSELLKKLQGFIPHDLKATLSKTGLLADYLHILKDMKTKQNNVQMFLEAFIKHLESRCGAPSGQEPASASASNAVTNLSEKNTNDPSAETPQDSEMEIDSDKCTGSSHLKRKHQGEEMSILLNKIKKIDQEAADGLEEADLRSDSEIKTLTEQDLHDLCPGLKKFKMRKSILETINKTDLVTEVLNVLWADDLKATLPDNGVLVDFLNILKDMKTQQNDVQMFLEDQIKRLESSCDAPSGQEPASASTSKAVVNQSGKSTKVLSKQTSQESHRITGFHGNSSHDSCGKPCSRSQKRGESTGSFYRYSITRKPPVTVKYKMVVSGKTFGADQQILDKIRSSAQELNLVDVEVNGCIEDDSQITLVFCPVVSRMGTDVEAAMKKVPDVKPVILVLMHHSHEVRHVGSMRSWTDKCKIVLHVNVFYHEKVPGLIICQQNDEAITAVKKEILTYGITDGHSGSDGATSTGFNSDGANDSASQKNNQAGLFSQIFSHLRP